MWRRQADPLSLQWHLEGVTYRIVAAGLEYHRRDLQRIANSQV